MDSKHASALISTKTVMYLSFQIVVVFIINAYEHILSIYLMHIFDHGQFRGNARIFLL